MEENHKHTSSDEIIRSRFGEAEIMPSSDAWEGIEKRLDENKRRPAFYYWLSGILLLLISGIVFYFGSDAHSKHPGEAQQLAAVVSAKPVQSATESSIHTDAADTKTPVAEEEKNVVTEEKKTENISAAAVEEEHGMKVAGTHSSAKAEPAIVAESRQKTLTVNKHTEAVSSVKRAKDNSPVSSASPPARKPEKTFAGEGSASAAAKEKNNAADAKAGKTDSAPASTVAEADEPAKEERPSDRPQVEETAATKKTEEPAKKVAEDSAKAETVALVKDSAAVKDSVKKSIAKEFPALKDSISDVIKKDKLFSIYFSPDYYGNTIHDSSDQQVKDEKRLPRYTAGVRFSCAVLDKLYVRAGISYSEIRQFQEQHELWFPRYTSDPFVFYSSFGEMSVDHSVMMQGFSPFAPATIEEFRVKYTYSQKAQLVNVPLELQYGARIKRFGISALLGISMQYIFKQHAELNVIKENVTNTLIYNDLGMKKISFTGIAGFKADYLLTKRLSVFLEPHARMGFGSPSTSKVVKSTPYFLGINAGLSLHF
jgi:hypothetical protein